MPWLTPNTDKLIGQDNVRTISVNPDLLSFIGGALQQLCEHWNWEEHGTATPEETADYFKQVRDDWGMSSFAEVGKIQGFVSLPDKWLAMDGTIRSFGTYSELEAVIPTSWHQRNGWQIPDLTMTSITGEGDFQTVSYPVGSLGGNNLHNIQVNELAAHSHQADQPVGDVLVAPYVSGVGELVSRITTNSPTSTIGSGVGIPVKERFLTVIWGIYAGR